MPSYQSPGIYPREIDFSFYVKQLSTAACGMLGIAERGPLNTPTLVTSWEQFLRAFGGYRADSYLAYAARAFFDNGGSLLYVTRIAHATDPTHPATITATMASVTLKDRATTPKDTLKVQARTPGTWGAKLTVLIQDGTVNPTTEFTLIVKEGESLVETFPDCSMDDTAVNHVELVISRQRVRRINRHLAGFHCLEDIVIQGVWVLGGRVWVIANIQLVASEVFERLCSVDADDAAVVKSQEILGMSVMVREQPIEHMLLL